MRRSTLAWWLRVLSFALCAVVWATPAKAVDAEADAGPSAPAPSSLPAALAPATAVAPASPTPVARAQSGEVRVKDKLVVVVRAPRGGVSPPERARATNAAIDALLARGVDLGEARFEEKQGTAVVYVGNTPILTLGPEDVEAAGEPSLDVLAAQVTTRLADAVSTERKRNAIATTVFSFSLLVFAGLLAFLLLGRISDAAGRLRAALVADPSHVRAIRLGNIEFLSAGAARAATSIGLTLAHRLAQLAVVYGWLIFGLSLFDATRGYTGRLTGMVVAPLYGLATRAGGSIPLVLVAVIAAVAVSVLIRFVGLFFDSVSRGDTRIAWLPRDLAQPTSMLTRFAIVVLAFVLASPMISGESDGVLSRIGFVALVAVALAATPLLASAAVGITIVFGRRLKRGDTIEVGGRSGRVLEVTLLNVKVEDESLCELTIPHLLALVHPIRVHKHAALTSIEVIVDASASQAVVERTLLEAARALSARARVELVSLDERGARWRVTSAATRHDVSLAKAVQEALRNAEVSLGGGEPA